MWRIQVNNNNKKNLKNDIVGYNTAFIFSPQPSIKFDCRSFILKFSIKYVPSNLLYAYLLISKRVFCGYNLFPKQKKVQFNTQNFKYYPKNMVIYKLIAFKTHVTTCPDLTFMKTTLVLRT